jgi:hypothetical protein
MSFEKREVVLMPTTSKTMIHVQNGTFGSAREKMYLEMFQGNIHNSAHLYFLSKDTDLITGDWYMTELPQCIFKYDRCKGLSTSRGPIKKIIASTDKSLGLGIPTIEFLQQYVHEYNKRTPIKKVLIEEGMIGYYPGVVGDVDIFGPIVNKENNTITIKLRKEKTKWKKEDIYKLCNKMLNHVGRDQQSEIWMSINYKQFIDDNL